MQHIVEKLLTRLQLCFKPHLNQRFAHKVMSPKVVGVPILGISKLPLGNLGKKCHLDAGLVARHKIYYMGEGGGFPHVRAMVSLVGSNLPMARSSTKSAPTTH